MNSVSYRLRRIHMGRELVYFMSDLHLGATYISDPRGHEARVCSFLRSIEPTARELYLMGDVLDYWYEYRTVVPRGHVRFFGTLAELADAGVKIYWFIGNHDIWLFDYLRDEIGITVVDGVEVKDIGGRRFFLSHGDGVGRLPAGFRFIRTVFRNKVCQKLYSAIHPRWTIPFAHRWSKGSRGNGYASVTVMPDVESDPLIRFCRDYLADVDPDIDYFVMGHRHIQFDYPLNSRSRLVLLGEWINQDSYAVFDGKELKLKVYGK